MRHGNRKIKPRSAYPDLLLDPEDELLLEEYNWCLDAEARATYLAAKAQYHQITEYYWDRSA